MAGSRPGGLIAGAWTAMMSLGLNGYLDSTSRIMEVSKKIQRGIGEIPGLFVIGKPDLTVVAFASDVVDIFEVKANPGPISGGMAPIYGAAGKMPDRGTVKELLVEFMDSSC
ncbi:unnamed protein product [Miscanthus lutarioriparius]|uniref:Uncharacterized protein n=1 Tax=Miscanthus lutarioriparius TaxID=422564 RepID=A0A811RPP5_9POAL|nr:unnamed protein product [Miscanthus lutarioriparius]